MTVQPVSLSYARFSNLPMDRDIRPLYAWYGDMELLPHMWEMLRAGVVTVVVQFHPATTITGAGGNRRSLAHHCEAAVREGHSLALAGRLPPRRRRRLRKLARRSGERPRESRNRIVDSDRVSRED